MSQFIKIIISGGTQPQRENLATKIARKHNLDDRPLTLGTQAIIRTYRNKKAVKNILKKEQHPDFKITLQLEKTQHKTEDFIFSLEQLQLIAGTQIERNNIIVRSYINGKEFTSRVSAGTKTNFEDAVIVAKNVFNADNNPNWKIIHKDDNARGVIKQIQLNFTSGQIFTKNHPERKPGWQMRIGFNTNSIVAPGKIFETTYQGKVRNYDNVNFNLCLSPLLNGDYVCKETFVLEIEARESERGHTKSLSLGGFGSHLYADYALAFSHIAKQFCNNNKLIINDERNHWPVLQYVVSIPQ